MNITVKSLLPIVHDKAMSKKNLYITVCAGDHIQTVQRGKAAAFISTHQFF